MMKGEEASFALGRDRKRARKLLCYLFAQQELKQVFSDIVATSKRFINKWMSVML